MEPLANKIRPQSLDQFVGQEHLVGEGKPLRVAIEQKHLFSFILWGPPGVGKTTLARIYAKAVNAEFFELSAVSAGKQDIKDIIDIGKLKNKTTPPASQPPLLIREGIGTSSAELRNQKPKILFLDEIHRFNKAQQDFLLPFVETGQLYLIGATTENPSFEVIPALLSRCRVFVLNELTDKDMKKVIEQAVASSVPVGKGLKPFPTNPVNQETLDWLVQMANGDARQAISMIENTLQLYQDLTIENFKNALQSKFLRYDKKGDEHYNTISAFIKSMRASQPDAAVYYLARMVDAGEDPKFIARRMVIFASEDIGMEDPHALVIANEIFKACETIGYPECAINLSHGVVYLSLAQKSKASYNALQEALTDVKNLGNLPIPLTIRNAPTKLMKDLDYGKGYEKYTTDDLLPEKLKGKKYYKSNLM